MDSLDAEPAWCGFFMPQHPDLVGGELWSESTWADRFRESDEAWIAQTYHRLRAAGYPVLACDHRNALEVPAIVTHPPHTPQLFAIKGIDHVAVAVTIADKTYGERGADLAIVQNAFNQWHEQSGGRPMSQISMMLAYTVNH